MSAGDPFSKKADMLRATILVLFGLILQLRGADYTFGVDNVTENQNYYFSKTTLENILLSDEHEVVFTEADHPEGCEFINKFDPFHSLAGAVHTAYAGHLPLVLSPDHIWVTILQGVSIHNSLVLPDLQCYDQADVSDAGEVVCDSWSDVASGVLFSLDSKLPVQVTLPNLPFTTTSAAANIAARTALASPYEDNLKYDTKTYCGIPKITLLGTAQDWEQLLQKTESLLSRCNLNWWLCALRTTLAEFVKAARGQEDVSFWRNIYRFRPDEPQAGSGCWEASGWIMTFYPYITQGTKGRYHQNDNLFKVCNESFQWSVAPVNKADQCPKIPELPSINTQDFPSGLTRVQVTCQSSGERLLVVAGFVGKCSQNDTKAVTPVLGWFVANDSRGDVCQLSDSGYCEDDCACSGHGKCEKTQSFGGAGILGNFGPGGGLFGNGGNTGEEKKSCKCFPGWSSVDCSRRCPEGSCGELCGEFCEENEVCDYVSGHCTAAPAPTPTMVQESSTTDVTSTNPSPVKSIKETTTTDVTSTSPPSMVAAPEPTNIDGVEQVDNICANMEKLKEVFCKSDVAGIVTLRSNSSKNGFVKGRFRFVLSQKSGQLSMTRNTFYYRVPEDVSSANPSRFEILSGNLLLMGSSMNKRLVELGQESLLKHCEESEDILKEVSKDPSSCGV